MRSSRIILRYLLGALLTVSSSHLTAQSASATANGTTTDPQGEVIPAATVTLTNQDTGVTRHATTNATGYFIFLDITPGPYTLAISKTGFRTNQLSDLSLLVNQTLTENQTLSVGAVTETVKVSAEQEGVMLQNSTSDLGNVIQTSEIQQLPLNGRN